MSLIQFYLENGLDMEDLQRVDEFFATFVEEEDLDGLTADSLHHRMTSSLSNIVGLTNDYNFTMDNEEKKEEDNAYLVSIHDPKTTTTTGVKPCPLLISTELDFTAETAGWTKLDTSRSDRIIAAYKQGDLYLEFDLMTSVVRGYDDWGQERVQRFCRVVEMAEAIEVFQRPQYQKHQKRCRYGRRCKNRFTTCPFEHPNPRRCRYGANCHNKNCAFDHF